MRTQTEIDPNIKGYRLILTEAVRENEYTDVDVCVCCGKTAPVIDSAEARSEPAVCITCIQTRKYIPSLLNAA